MLGLQASPIVIEEDASQKNVVWRHIVKVEERARIDVKYEPVQIDLVDPLDEDIVEGLFVGDEVFTGFAAWPTILHPLIVFLR